jgi:chromosome segregation ATPase
MAALSPACRQPAAPRRRAWLAAGLIAAGLMAGAGPAWPQAADPPQAPPPAVADAPAQPALGEIRAALERLRARVQAYGETSGQPASDAELAELRREAEASLAQIQALEAPAPADAPPTPDLEQALRAAEQQIDLLEGDRAALDAELRATRAQAEVDAALLQAELSQARTELAALQEQAANALAASAGDEDELARLRAELVRTSQQMAFLGQERQRWQDEATRCQASPPAPPAPVAAARPADAAAELATLQAEHAALTAAHAGAEQELAETAELAEQCLARLQGRDDPLKAALEQIEALEAELAAARADRSPGD